MSRKTRQQDRASTKARIAPRKARVIDLCVHKGKTVREAALILKEEGVIVGANKTSVGETLQLIQRDFSQMVPQERAKAYDRLQGFLDELETAKKSGKLDLRASISDSLAVMDRLSRLLGTDAPTKSISAKVTLFNTTALVGYRKFVAVTCHMDAATLEKVYTFASKLNVPPAVRVVGPPATSELWDEPKQPTWR